jgi:hypothetical protein
MTPIKIMHYEVELADEPVFADVAPPQLDAVAEEATLDRAGVSERVAAVAAQVMGAGPPLERAHRLERHLATSYRYSTEFVGRSGQLPLERFLFEERRGHCEFFATAMVVMLRSQGIPARLVTGFLGGEPGTFEGYYIVRQGNAHAWVEAWIPQLGWRLFDPTPAAGRPGATSDGLAALFGQAWDYMLFRWDRYVLTFGFYDQLDLLMRARSLWASLWRLFEGDSEEAAKPADEPAALLVAEAETAAATAGSGWRDWIPWLGGLLLFAALAAAAWWRWSAASRRRTATETYRRLRDRLQRRGLQVPSSLPPLRLAASAAATFPAAAAPTDRLIHLYLRESFAGEELTAEELGEAADSLRAVTRVLKKAG